VHRVGRHGDPDGAGSRHPKLVVRPRRMFRHVVRLLRKRGMCDDSRPVRQAIGEVLPLAIAAAISPFPIIGVVLMLVTPRARVNGPMFVVGWLLGLAAVGLVGLAAAGAIGASDD